MRKALTAVDDAIARVERGLLLGMVSVMLLLIVGQIVLRIARINLSWADELARYLMLWVAILGASLATRARAHITIDITTRGLSARGRARASVVAGTVGVALCAFLCVVGIHYVRVEVASGYASRALGAPFWAVKSIIPLGLALIGWRFFLGAIDDVAALRSGDLRRFGTHLPAELGVMGTGEALPPGGSAGASATAAESPAAGDSGAPPSQPTGEPDAGGAP